jgi:hypothetical protein
MQSLELRVDPQFVHRPLAVRALGVDGDAPLGRLADDILRGAMSAGIEDIRTAAATGHLAQLVDRLTTVRAGFYFSPGTVDGRTSMRFHDRIKVDDSVHVRVEGTFDPSRCGADSAATNLTGRQHVYVVGLVRSFQPDGNIVELQPLLIGFPYFAPAGQAVDRQSAPRWAEVFPGTVEQFALKEKELGRAATAAQLNKAFALPRERVLRAFATIFGVPGDRSGEASDLLVDVTVDGETGRCAFVFTDPGGRSKPWTLYPSELTGLGEQGLRLFTEPADLYAIQHSSRIAESVRHLMEALAVTHGKRFLLVDGDLTFKILRKAQLLD